jgi:hypothetical protein
VFDYGLRTTDNGQPAPLVLVLVDFTEIYN